MEPVKHLPLPYFKINKEYKILLMSEKAKQTFLIGDGFLSLVDEGSHKKVRTHITPEKPSASLELILKTKADPMVLFQMEVNWQENEAHIICTEMKSQFDEISGKLQQLRERLAETNFALMEQKEQLEQTTKRVNRLSGPFIPLSEEVAIVPLFGDLTEEKLSVINSGILHSLYHTEFHYILFDFTAVAKIDPEGIKGLEELFKTIQLMGQETIICGVKPQHAQLITEFHWLLDSKKINSLSGAVRKYIKQDFQTEHPAP